MFRLTTMVSALLLMFFGTAPCVSETVDVNGVELHYTIHGDGPPLLLLHGYGGTGDRTWKHLLPKFKPHFQLIVPDLRGHGRSSFTKDNFTHRQAAKDVLALLDQLEISSTSAIGNSTGAMTLLHVATIAPERVKSMVLNSATTHFPESARAIMETVKDDGESALGDYFADERMAAMHKLGPKQHEWLRRSFREMKDDETDMNFNQRALKRISASTLIVHGDRDQLFPIDIPVTLYKNIPNSKLWIVPGQDHNAAWDPNSESRILEPWPWVSICLSHLK